MRELIAKKLCEISWNNWEKQWKGKESFYYKRADAVLTLISEEIEKVENPSKKYKGTPRDVGVASEVFESCRQKILTLLRSEK